MENLEVAIEKMISVLKYFTIFDFLKDSDVYIGGSLPMLCLSTKTDINYLIKNIGDIDLYTPDLSHTIRDLNNTFNGKIKNIFQNGVNVKFNLEGIDNMEFQLMTSGFDDFAKEVLCDYDCDLVSVGFQCRSLQFLITDRFLKGLENKCFNLLLEKTFGNRIEKLTLRAKFHFNSDLNIIEGHGAIGSYRPYIIEGKPIESLLECVRSPPYLQTYFHKYKCIKCNDIQTHLICSRCNELIHSKFINLDLRDDIKHIIIFGAVNGLGRIIGNVARDNYKLNVVRTGRKINDASSDNDKSYPFELGSNMCPELIAEVINSKLIIMNAYQTLEGDHKIWNNTIFNFDYDLAIQRFTVNCFGYVKLLKDIITIRTEMVKKGVKLDKLILVFMDAAESKFEDKVLRDGKHLELNMAKCATKQIFYTCGDLLSMLNIDVICYDPGWLSFHGISVEKIESKSEFLIAPELSSRCLLNYCLGKEKRKEITDLSIYDCL
jgi:hypothetical protein